MQELVYRLRNAFRTRPIESLVVLGTAATALAVISCLGCIALAAAVGSALTLPAGATEQAATGMLPLDTPAPPAEMLELAATTAPMNTITASEPSPPAATPPPTTTQGTAGAPRPTDLPVTATLLQPLDMPAPDEVLELTASTQLTLSAVIFVENIGQFAADTRFQMRGALGGGVWLAPDAIWTTLLESPHQEADAPQGVHLKLSFVGANPSPRLVPFERLDTHASYFSGGDPANWHTNAPVWGGVRYEGLYPGVDLELTSEDGRYIQRLVVHPGDDDSTEPVMTGAEGLTQVLSAVRLRVEGADALTLEPLTTTTGGHYLRLTTALGELSLPLFQVVASGGTPLPLHESK